VGFYEKRAQRAAARAIDAMPHPRWVRGRAVLGPGAEVKQGTPLCRYCKLLHLESTTRNIYG
jgi:hypothetical protein